MLIFSGWRGGSDQSGAAQTGSGQESGYGDSQRGNRGSINVEAVLHFVLYIKFLSTKLYSLIINKKKSHGVLNTRHPWKDIYLFHAAHTWSIIHTVFTALTLYQDRNITCSSVIWQAVHTRLTMYTKNVLLCSPTWQWLGDWRRNGSKSFSVLQNLFTGSQSPPSRS